MEIQIEASAPMSMSFTRTRLDDIKPQVLDLPSSLGEKLRALTGNSDGGFQGSSGDVASMKESAKSIANDIEVLVTPPSVNASSSSKSP